MVLKTDETSYYKGALDKNNIQDISTRVKKEGDLNTKYFNNKIISEKKM
ncbi:MAG: hypothetical protein MJK08_09910 [Campylobacterales bacterium]|nr:hypothetical protein [Campylobacterales bacterium]